MGNKILFSDDISTIVHADGTGLGSNESLWYDSNDDSSNYVNECCNCIFDIFY